MLDYTWGPFYGAAFMRLLTVLFCNIAVLGQSTGTRMHDPVKQTGEWLKSVVKGYFNYHAVPGNLDSLAIFRKRLRVPWWHNLRRRSQQRQFSCNRMMALGERWLPQPSVLRPYPAVRFAASHPR